MSINLTLMVLRKVISALAEAENGDKNAAVVPYRESVLTFLLKVR